MSQKKNSDTGFLASMNSIVENASPEPSSSTTFERPLMNSNEFDAVVHSRRSVRVFTGERIDSATMYKLFELAHQSPSSSNIQPWEFHWIKASEVRANLVKACFSQPAARTAGELVVIIARKGTWRRNIQEIIRQLTSSSEKVPPGVLKYYKTLIPKALALGPFYMAVPFKWLFTRVARYKQPTPQEPIGMSDLRVWAHKSTALAAQTFMLACRAHNLDSCPMEGFDSWRVKRLLKLPPDAEISMIVAVGKAKPEGLYGHRMRFDKAWHVFEV